MNEFLNAIKVDLLDRRRRPILILLVAAFIGAVAFAALGGSSSGGSATSALAPEPTPPPSGLRVTQGQPNPNEAVAETTSGESNQRRGESRDPFRVLPGSVQPAKQSSSQAAGSSSSSAGAGGAGASSSPAASGGTTPAPSAPAPAQPKGKTTYRVSVLFGKTAPKTPVAEANLTPYEDLKLNQLLPSKAQPLLAFRGVTVTSAGARNATFTLVGEAIPRGPGACRPSALDCQALELAEGQTEELEFQQPNGEVVYYELEPVAIVFASSGGKAAAASAGIPASHSSYGAGVSPAGSSLLRRLGLLAIPGLRYSRDTGLLYAPAPAHAAE